MPRSLGRSEPPAGTPSTAGNRPPCRPMAWSDSLAVARKDTAPWSRT